LFRVIVPMPRSYAPPVTTGTSSPRAPHADGCLDTPVPIRGNDPDIALICQ